MDMNLGKLLEMVKDREAWCYSGVARNRRRLGDLNNNIKLLTTQYDLEQMLSFGLSFPPAKC